MVELGRVRRSSTPIKLTIIFQSIKMVMYR
jgi:hypothetical protein